MSLSYPYKHWGRLLLLITLVLGLAGPGQAQLYYLTTDGTAASQTANDALNRLNTADNTTSTLVSSIAVSPNQLTLDPVNNRAFVYEALATSRGIKVYSLNSPVTLLYTLPVPAQVSAIEYDAASDYVYFLTTDGVAATLVATDALNRIKADNSAPSEVLLSQVANSPVYLALNAAGNRAYIYEGLTASRGIKTVNLATRTLIGATIPVPAAVAALDYTAFNGNLYFLTSDGVGTTGTPTATDALYRVQPNDSNTPPTPTAVITSLTNSPAYLALDLANNRIYVADNFTNSRGFRIINATTNAVTVVSQSLQFAALEVAQQVAPTVFTTDASSITATSAVLGGNITANGGAEVTERGVVYSSSATTPAIGGTGVTQNTNGAGNGSFSETISGLTAGTTYYVRAYATNSAGTSYGEVRTFTTLAVTAPTVTTAAVANLGSTSARLGGNVTANGNAEVTERGVVYSSSATTPAIGGTGVTQDANGAGNGSFSETISGLTASTTYYVRAYAINSAGTSYGTVISFTTAAPVSGTTVVTNVSCFGGSNGTINLTPRGGLGPYTYLWNDGATTEDRTGLSAGAYSVTITDALGATGTVNNIIVTQRSAISATTSQTNIACNGGATGAAAVSPVGGTSPYTYRWSTGATTQAITGLPAGAYSVTITDANGCTRVYNFNITQPSALTASTSQTNVTTNGGNNGSATITVGGGTPSYTYSWSPNVSTTATASNLSAGTYSVTATDANGCTISRSFTITQPAVITLTSVTRQDLSPTAMSRVFYQVVFSGNVTGLTVSNFKATATSGTIAITGTGISSVVGSGTTYRVGVNTGTGSGTLRLDMVNSTGTSPTVTGLPYTAGQEYTITKSFAAQPQLTIQGTGGTGSDVTAFVDVVQVFSGGTAFANSLQNPSFETHDPLANGDFGYQPTGASWTFNAQAGIAESGSAFTPVTPIPNGIAVAFVQSNGGSNGQLQQNLALPTGSSYQVSFQTAQRVCCTTLDQALNVFLNGVFIGTIQPGSSNYSTFTSATFSVAAPAVTAAISSTATSPTATSPIPVNVTFSESVTGFDASDVTVSNGTVSGFSGSGTSYSFNVTPLANGTVTVNVPANAAIDGNNTGNTAASQFSIQYSQAVTAAPVVVIPSDGSFVTTTTPTYQGTAPANSTVRVYVDGTLLPNTTTANNTGNWTITQSTALAQGSHTVYATAQTNGAAVSANSNTNTFTVDSVRPSVAIASTATSPTGTSPIPFTVTFSENVTGFVAGDVTVTGGSITGNVVNGTSPGTTYTFTVTPSANGTVTVSIPANVAQDAAGNGNTAAPQFSITYSQAVTAAPVVLIPSNGSFVTTTTPTYQGTAPAGSTVRVYVDGTLLPNTTTANNTGNWTITQSTALAQGSHTVYATAQTNGSAVSANSNTNTFTVDSVSPSVAISSAATNPTNTSPIPVSVTFSESVTGFDASDVTVSNGTASAFSGSGTSYSFNVTPAGNGTVTVSVAANVAQDAAGNGNTAAPQFSIQYNQTTTAAPVVLVPANGSLTNNRTVTISGTAPANSTVMIYFFVSPITVTATAAGTFSYTIPDAVPDGVYQVRATAQSAGELMSGFSNANTFRVDGTAPTVAINSTATSPTATSPIPVSVTFSESVTGFDASDVTVSNGTVSAFSGSGTSYSFTVTPAGNGTVTVSVAANVAQDAAGNGNTAAPQFSIQYTAVVTATVWTGNVSTDWFTAGNWTAGVPTATVDATINSTASRFPVVASGTAEVKNLILGANAALTQSGGTLAVSGQGFAIDGTFTATGGVVSLNGSSEQRLGGVQTSFWDLTVGPAGARLDGPAAIQRILTLNGNLTTIGNTFTLLSNAATTAMVVNNGGSVAGTATVQRYIDPSLNSGLGYRHYSSPVQSTTVADLATSGFAPVVNPDYNTVGNTVSPFPTVYGYNEGRLASTSATSQDFDYGYFSPTTLNDNLTRGRGYTVNISASEKVDLVGTLTTGDVAVGALTRGGETNSGWQLLGNPYPAPLDWKKARTNLPTGMIDAIYVYKSSSQYGGTYQFYQNGFGTLPNGIVPSMQGFFVRVSQPVPAFSFLNAWRSTVFETATFNRPAADVRPALQLDLVSGQNVHDPAYVYFEQGATAGLDDHYDAEKLPNTTGLNLASVAVGKGLAVNGLPFLQATTLVPLTVGVPVTGSYTLQAASLANFGSTPVYLLDAETGQQIDLKQQSSYRFSASNAALITGRFSLSFGSLQPLATNNGQLASSVALYPNPASKTAWVELPAELSRKPVTAQLLDAVGRVVRTQQLPANGGKAHALSLAELPVGVYSLRLSTEAGMITKRLIIE